MHLLLRPTGGSNRGFDDDESIGGLAALRPLNAYGWSKKATDDIIAACVAAGAQAPPQWVGLKFFNIYGPNEYHKGDMRSVAVQIYESIAKGDPVPLFKSHRECVAHGEQRRDFVHVHDCGAGSCGSWPTRK
jgi:ADP-L-glycero-D-manno-heptose 6-epimerase